MNREEAEDLNGEIAPETTDEEDVALLKQALSEEREKSEANLAGWQRTQADFTNYKRRVEKELEETRRFANGTLMFNLLPVLDDFERAIAAISNQETEVSLIEGIQLIERKFRSTLESQGLTQIKAVGKPFDPHIHEAVMETRGKDGMVVEEVQKGYQLHDRVIRPAKVIVGSGEEEKKEE